MKTPEEQHRWHLVEHAGNVVCVLVVLVWVCTAVVPAAARAEAPAAAVQLALLSPLQLIDEQRSVTAFRLSILHGANRDVRGLDLAAGTTRTEGVLRGLQLAGGNEVNGDCTGMQVGVFVNYVEGRLSGVQLSGLAAYAGRGAGVQIAGVMARAEKLRGFQFALITVSEEMKGLQLGLLNFNAGAYPSCGALEAPAGGLSRTSSGTVARGIWASSSSRASMPTASAGRGRLSLPERISRASA